MLQWFAFDHLPDDLAIVSRQFYFLAHALVGEASMTDLDGESTWSVRLEGPELTVALRKLLEAKDAAVRATIEARNGRTG